jgi:acetyl/propionyl-CoA carboxylase alpha subunit
MAEAAVALAQAVGYVNAGTVECVVDGSPQGNGRFYFLEMNTRLQVEHPVTELVTGVDLVTWQIRIAAGEPLTLAQEAVRQRGHAIECRLYAEDVANQFLPSTGQVAYYRPPAGPGVRVDDGIETGMPVSPYYDPMLAKVIAWGRDRAEAVAKMRRALRDTVVLGVTTNISYLLDILNEPAFIDGRTDTTFLSDHMMAWQPQVEAGDSDWLALAVFEELQGGSQARRTGAAAADGESATVPDPWNDPSGWRNVNAG